MEMKVGPLTLISFMFFQIILSSESFTERKVGCDKAKLDLIFVLDAFTGVDPFTSVTELKFLIENFVKYFLFIRDIDNGNVLVGVVICSTVQFQLNSYNTKVQVFEAINDILYLCGSTNTADGLNTMRTQMFTASNGDRPDVQNIAIVITDGISNSRRTISEAKQARAEGIHIFAIGIGLMDTTELDGIASKPVDENRFVVKEFSELRVLRDKVLEAVCPRDKVHLSGGDKPSQGRVEIKINGVWGTVCNDNFDVRDAVVICRMLGYITSTPIVRTGDILQPFSGPIHLDEVNCYGNESNIFDCKHQPVGKNDCNHSEDVEIICLDGPPNITMDGGDIYFAHVDEPFTLQFQVESYYSSNISNVSVVGKDGIERILHEIGDWTQNSAKNVKDIKITLTIANVTSDITNCKFFLTVRNEWGRASASFMLAEKGKPCERSANQRIRDAYINTKLKTLKIEFQFECHPVPKISGIHIQNKAGSMVLPESQWHQIIIENTPQPLITTISLSIQYTSDDVFVYQYFVNFTNSEGTTTLDFGVSTHEVAEKGENSLMAALIAASTVALIVVTVGVVIWKKMGGSLYSKLKRKKRIDISSYSGLDANGRFFNSAQEELEEVYDEIVECSEVDNEPVKAEHTCMLIPNQNDVLSPLPTCCTLDDPYSDLQKEPSGENNIGDNHLASSQPEQSDYLHCLHDSFETASVESGNFQYLYPVYSETIVSNSASLAVAQDSDYESPKYVQHIFVFKTTSRTEQPRTELDERDQQTESA